MQDSFDVLRDGNVLKNAFELVTQPLLSAIYLLYDRQSRQQISYCGDVELTALFERLLAYCVSGSARMIHAKSMRLYGIQAAINAGMPQIRANHPALPCPTFGSIAQSLRIDMAFLPVPMTGLTPDLLGAMASIRYHAGSDIASLYYELVQAHTQIQHLLRRGVENILGSFIKEQIDLCLQEFSIQLRDAIACKQLQEIDNQIKKAQAVDGSVPPDECEEILFREERREEAVNVWLQQDYPFAIQSLSILLTIFGQDDEVTGQKLPCKGTTNLPLNITLNKIIKGLSDPNGVSYPFTLVANGFSWFAKLQALFASYQQAGIADLERSHQPTFIDHVRSAYRSLQHDIVPRLSGCRLDIKDWVCIQDVVEVPVLLRPPSSPATKRRRLEYEIHSQKSFYLMMTGYVLMRGFVMYKQHWSHNTGCSTASTSGASPSFRETLQPGQSTGLTSKKRYFELPRTLQPELPWRMFSILSTSIYLNTRPFYSQGS